MKKNIFVFIISILCSHSIFANNVSKVMAVQEVKNFLQMKTETISPNNTLQAKTISSTIADIDTSNVMNYSLFGNANMYMVNIEGGWMLLSTETAVKPILAYSLSEEFPNNEEMPDGLKWLISYYEDVIAYAKDSLTEQINAWDRSTTKNVTFTNEESVNINALGDVKWGQSGNNSNESNCNRVYNKYCPTFHDVSCSRTIVGCGAVALGQVLWYYKWPHYGLVPKEMLNDQGSVSNDEEFKYYNWDLMPAEILSATSLEEINMTAGFLRDCGYAEHMEYGSNGSNTYVSSIKTALEHSFNYENVQQLYRPNISNWVERMKNEIRNGRPIIYRGVGPSGGHFFILHGFIGDYFNINWGWRGSWNGTMCTLDALNVSGTNFNSGHYALVNIAPTYPNCTPINIASSELWSNNFVVQNGGGITIGNRVVSGEQQGVIYSGEYIRLATGTHFQAGAKVHLAIRDMGCNGSIIESNAHAQQNAPAKPRKTSEVNINPFSVSPNPANDILNITTTEQIEQVRIYNLNGQCVLQTKQTEINVSGLHDGIYLLQAVTSDGEPLQAKFIKQ